MMKKFLLVVALFLIIPATLVRWVGNFDAKDAAFSHNNNVISLQHKNEFDSLDILFTGNSYCYAGIIPRVFDSVGLQTLNLGIATCGPQFYELIINDYLEHTKQQPKAIFILLSPILFSTDADNFAEYPVHRYLLTPLSNEQLAQRFGLYNKYIDYTIRSFKKGTTNLLKKQPLPDVDEYRLNKGFITKAVAATENDIQQAAKLYEPLRKETFNQSKFEQLMQLVMQLKGKGIQVVFYQLPSNRLEDFFSTNYMEGYHGCISELAKTEIVINQLNLLRDKYYRDIDHLNTDGANICSNSLLDSIKNNNTLNQLLFVKP